MRDLLRVADLEPGELMSLLDLAAAFRAEPRSFAHAGEGRVVAVVFEKPSLRTRFSVEAALAKIGAHPVGAYDREVGLGSREPIADAARVLSGYVDSIVMRTHEHARVEELAAAADVPVLNALSDTHHPLQALADLMTLCGGDASALRGRRLAYVGDGNNVAHSLIEAGALAGVDVVCACPPGLEPDPEIVAWGRASVTPDPRAAVHGADAVYTDVWVSMGQDAQGRHAKLEGYRVTEELMSLAAPGAMFLHCLPAHRGEEVEARVIDGPASKVVQQAHNRMHTSAAVFLTLFA